MIRWLFIPCFMIGLVTTAAVGSTAPNDHKKDIEQLARWYSGQTREIPKVAVESVEQWVLEHPRDGESLYLLFCVAQCRAQMQVPGEREHAIRLLKAAAATEYPPALAGLGWATVNGQGIPKDTAAGMVLVRKALTTGDPEAHLLYGQILAYRLEGGEPKWEEAIEHLHCAGEKGLVRAWAPLWLVYRETGRGGEKLELLRKGAEGGDVLAQFLLFNCYAEGRFVARDLHEAERWGVLAASAGDGDCRRALGEFYIKLNTERGNAEAVRWLNSAYAAGDKKAAYLLGVGYLNEAGKPGADPQTGLKLLREAADAGVPEAEDMVALQYLIGVFVPRDLTTARRWFERAAAHGSSEARRKLKWLDYTERHAAGSIDHHE